MGQEVSTCLCICNEQFIIMYVCMYYIGTSDFITLHTPLTAETKNLLNDATLAKCKRGLLHSFIC